MGLLSGVSCVSCLIYVPKRVGGGKVGTYSRQLCYALKRGDASTIAKIAERLGQRHDEDSVLGVLRENAALVPMPRCAPLTKSAVWPALMLAKAMVSKGLGASVLPILKRSLAVQNSATAAPGERPTARTHLDSFQVDTSMVPISPILIVDDVVTSGSTMLAAISAISDAIPGPQPKGFALFRTHPEQDLQSLWSPVCSRIALYSGNRTQRDP